MASKLEQKTLVKLSKSYFVWIWKLPRNWTLKELRNPKTGIDGKYLACLISNCIHNDTGRATHLNEFYLEGKLICRKPNEPTY